MEKYLGARALQLSYSYDIQRDTINSLGSYELALIATNPDWNIGLGEYNMMYHGSADWE